MGWAVLVAPALRAVSAVVTVGAAQPRASAAVGAGVDGQVVHRRSLSGGLRRWALGGGVAVLHAEIVVARNVVRHVNCDPTAQQGDPLACGACLMRFRIAAAGGGVLDANAN